MNNENMKKNEELFEELGYRNLGLLSEGGHGITYLVQQINEEGYVYVLKSYFSNGSLEACHEAEIIGEMHKDSLGDPHFFDTKFVNSSDNTSFLLTRSRIGDTLEKIKKEMSVAEATDIMIAACLSISRMHKKGFLHLDIKPDNLYKVALDGVSLVVPIDFGSTIKKGEKKYEEIVNGIGYFSTNGYLSRKLRGFCAKLETYNGIYTSKEEQIELIEAEKKINEKEDIFSLIATYFNLISKRNYGDFDHKFCLLPTKEKIRLTLEENDIIPSYLIPLFVDFFYCIEAPSRDEEAEVPFASVDDVIKKLTSIKEIIETRGFHPEICKYYSAKKMKEDRDWSKFFENFDPDLLCRIEEIKS